MPGFRPEIPLPGRLPPAELLAIGRSEGARYGVEFITETVTGIDAGFAVTLRDG